LNRRAAVLAIVALIVLSGGCQRPAPPAPTVAEDPEVLAGAALERGDYPGAAALYRKALVLRPESVSAHFGLGVATSNLNLRDDTIREFQWVVARGAPGSTEVAAARSWLIAAGVLRAPVAATDRSAYTDTGWNGSIEGRVYTGAAEQPQPLTRMQLHLVGQPDGPTKEERKVLRTDQEGRFKFTNVVPGSYMLTDVVAGKPRWRLKIEVSPNSTLRLDLSQGNSADVRNDFPGRG
jgi:TPR repeat